jgi:hypothetical protein
LCPLSLSKWGIPFGSGYALYLFKPRLRVAQSPFKKDAATIPNAGAILITISNLKTLYSIIFLIWLNAISKINVKFQNLAFPYIPYMVECNFNNNFKFHKTLHFLIFLIWLNAISITISKFKIQYSLFNISIFLDKTS